MSLGGLFQNLDLQLSANGTLLSESLKQDRIRRGNTPSGALDHVFTMDTMNDPTDDTLWIVDRILEPQTIVHFLESASWGHLPNGEQPSLPAFGFDTEVTDFLQQPMSEWALPPYNALDEITLERIMVRIGSMEDGSRLAMVSKELHSMKSRLWEGVVPLSERRWNDLQLDAPENFDEACQYITAVINVFHYLNLDPIKGGLRETYNLIWDHLSTFEEALNAVKDKNSKDRVPVTQWWHQYIKALFQSIEGRAHQWTIEHIDRLREPILAQLDVLPEQELGEEPSEEIWELTNKLHDLLENAAQADSTIFIPMDGYRGEETPSQDNVPPPGDDTSPYREEPISFSGNTLWRKADYYCRLKYLTRVETWSNFDAGEGGESLQQSLSRAAGPASNARAQVRAQDRTRLELRGEPKLPERHMWVTEAKRQLDNMPEEYKDIFVVYRMSHDHTEAEWERFKTKFEEDAKNWGSELHGIEDIQSPVPIQWLDAKDYGVTDGDIQGLIRADIENHAVSIMPANSHSEIFLVADKEVVDSYLSPTPGQGGYILAVDVLFDPSNPDQNRADESSGYDGTLRILSSLLWDDLNALIIMQTQHLEDLWPLAMHHPKKVYEGPVTHKIRNPGGSMLQGVFD